MPGHPSDGQNIPPLRNERSGISWPHPPPRADAQVQTINSRDAAIRIARLLDSRYEMLECKPGAALWSIRPVPTLAPFVEIKLDITGDDPLASLVRSLEESKGNGAQTSYGIDVGRLRSALPELHALHKMVGLKTLKNDLVDQIAYYAQGFHKRVEGGEGGDYLHTVIHGPPGTGKTEIAKLLGTILCKLGALPDTKFVKACRADLVAGYLGQTAIKTKDMIESALGGVLFIDEAYALGHPDKIDSFAKECVDTLCEAMSVHRNNLMVVVAGYQEELKNCFFRYNPGLESRFAWRYSTDKYTAEELSQMFIAKIKNDRWTIEPTDSKIRTWFTGREDQFRGYGRDVDTLITKIRIAHARRVFGKPDSKDKISLQDIEAGHTLFVRNQEVKEKYEPPLCMYS